MSTDDLARYRSEINDIDEQIMKLIAKRQATVIKIGHLKATAAMPAFQAERHHAVEEACAAQAVEHGLNPEMTAIIWTALMHEAIRIQENIAIEGAA